jgi:hypothetical protein
MFVKEHIDQIRKSCHAPSLSCDELVPSWSGRYDLIVLRNSSGSLIWLSKLEGFNVKYQ